MKFGRKLLATLIAAVLVVALSIVAASAADYTVKPGGSVNVTLTVNAEGIDGTATCSGGASVSYSASESGGVNSSGTFYLYAEGTKTVTATVQAPSGASVGDVYTVTFAYYSYDYPNGEMVEKHNTVSYTVQVVSGGSPSTPSNPSTPSTPSTPTTKVDLSKLQELIDKASNLKKDGYTDDSWNNLLDALTKAQAALSSTKQEDIDTAAKNLQNAIAALVKMDYSQLQAAIEKAKAMGKDNEVNSLWLALLDALSNGDRLLSSGDQAQVDAAAKQINELIEKLLNSDSKSCGIAIHKVWPILFFISLAANVVLVVILVSKKSTKKKNQVDNTPLVDYDINDDE